MKKKTCICKDLNDYDYDVIARVRLVKYGYQIDLFIDGKEVGFACRDFGGNWPIKKMSEVVAVTLMEAMRDVESNAQKLKNRKVQNKQPKVPARNSSKTIRRGSSKSKRVNLPKPHVVRDL